MHWKEINLNNVLELNSSASWPYGIELITCKCFLALFNQKVGMLF